MKMSKETYDALARDFWLVAHAMSEAKGPFTLTLQRAWEIFHRVGQERAYRDDLRERLACSTGVPCTVAHVPGYRTWFVYDDLTDKHIEIALRKILAA